MALRPVDGTDQAPPRAPTDQAATAHGGRTLAARLVDFAANPTVRAVPGLVGALMRPQRGRAPGRVAPALEAPAHLTPADEVEAVLSAWERAGQPKLGIVAVRSAVWCAFNRDGTIGNVSFSGAEVTSLPDLPYVGTVELRWMPKLGALPPRTKDGCVSVLGCKLPNQAARAAPRDDDTARRVGRELRTTRADRVAARAASLDVVTLDATGSLLSQATDHGLWRRGAIAPVRVALTAGDGSGVADGHRLFLEQLSSEMADPANGIFDATPHGLVLSTRLTDVDVARASGVYLALMLNDGRRLPEPVSREFTAGYFQGIRQRRLSSGQWGGIHVYEPDFARALVTPGASARGGLFSVSRRQAAASARLLIHASFWWAVRDNVEQSVLEYLRGPCELADVFGAPRRDAAAGRDRQLRRL